MTVPTNLRFRAKILLASAERTADTNSPDQFNINANLNVRGILVTLDVTAITDTPSLTLKIQAKDPGSDKYETLMAASAAVTGTGTHSYLLYPGAGSAADDITQVAGFPLPPAWRVRVEHADTDAATYSVGALLLP